MSKWLNDINLIGNKVKLMPLALSHREALLDAAADGALWNLWFTSVPSIDNIDQYLETALNDHAANRALPFVVIDLTQDKVIGATRFCNVVPQDRRLEIGYTWYAKSYQRTGVNMECKYLLLQHAFEHLDAIAVEFRTHWHNHASRRAISRLGAKQDGILRNHRIVADGSIRDTVVFSIIESEWKAVKKSLEYEMNRAR